MAPEGGRGSKFGRVLPRSQGSAWYTHPRLYFSTWTPAPRSCFSWILHFKLFVSGFFFLVPPSEYPSRCMLVPLKLSFYVSFFILFSTCFPILGDCFSSRFQFSLLKSMLISIHKEFSCLLCILFLDFLLSNLLFLKKQNRTMFLFLS